ncbi:putative ankyrin repeat protein [Aerococcus phage vB_AviM_AVP]|nr:putative ankyrin repeat protein [Aerococcus phage vB_AviM_AVP]
MVISLKPRHLDTNNLTPNLLDRRQIKNYYGLGRLIYDSFYFEGYPLNLQLSTLKSVNGVTMIDSVIDITDEPTEDGLIRLVEYMERG